MADRKLTVLNPAGYMEILQSSDNLVLDGSLQMTGTITDLPNCVNDNDAARKKYVDDSVAAIVSGAPSALDTLNELAAAIADDSNYATTITTALGLKSPIASPTFTGTPAAPTASAGTSTTQLATTAFVATSFSPLASPTFTGTVTVAAMDGEIDCGVYAS